MRQKFRRIMVLGFAYGKHSSRPGLSNCDLIRALYYKNNLAGHVRDELLILQQELANALCEVFPGHNPALTAGIIKKHRLGPDHYLDTDEVARQGVSIAAAYQATDLFVLAYPWLHRPVCIRAVNKLAKPHNINVHTVRTGWIRSDPESLQWWTRHPLLLPLYVIKSLLLKFRGA